MQEWSKNDEELSLLLPLRVSASQDERRERVWLMNEASFGSLRVLWLQFVQKSTMNSVRARAFRIRFLSGLFHLCTKPPM